jgi:hypothetical protein
MLVAALSVLPRLLFLCVVALFWLVDLVLEHMVKVCACPVRRCLLFRLLLGIFLHAEDTGVLGPTDHTKADDEHKDGSRKHQIRGVGDLPWLASPFGGLNESALACLA